MHGRDPHLSRPDIHVSLLEEPAHGLDLAMGLNVRQGGQHHRGVACLVLLIDVHYSRVEEEVADIKVAVGNCVVEGGVSLETFQHNLFHYRSSGRAQFLFCTSCWNNSVLCWIRCENKCFAVKEYLKINSTQYSTFSLLWHIFQDSISKAYWHICIESRRYIARIMFVSVICWYDPDLCLREPCCMLHLCQTYWHCKLTFVFPILSEQVSMVLCRF